MHVFINLRYFLYKETKEKRNIMLISNIELELKLEYKIKIKNKFILLFI